MKTCEKIGISRVALRRANLPINQFFLYTSILTSNSNVVKNIFNRHLFSFIMKKNLPKNISLVGSHQIGADYILR